MSYSVRIFLVSTFFFLFPLSNAFGQRAIEYYEPDFDSAYFHHQLLYKDLIEWNSFPIEYAQFFSKTYKKTNVRKVEIKRINKERSYEYDSVNYVFDKDGYLQSCDLYGVGAYHTSHLHEEKYTYSSDRLIVTCIYDYRTMGSSWKYKRIFKYNCKRLLELVIEYHDLSDTLPYSQRYEYDSLNRLINIFELHNRDSRLIYSLQYSSGNTVYKDWYHLQTVWQSGLTNGERKILKNKAVDSIVNLFPQSLDPLCIKDTMSGHYNYLFNKSNSSYTFCFYQQGVEMHKSALYKSGLNKNLLYSSSYANTSVKESESRFGYNEEELNVLIDKRWSSTYRYRGTEQQSDVIEFNKQHLPVKITGSNLMTQFKYYK